MSTELDAILEDVDRRLHSVEQTLTGSDVMGQVGTDPNTGTPVVGGVPITIEPPDAVTDVTVTVGSYFDDIFADVEWEEALEGVVAVSFDVELFLRTAGPTYELLTVASTGGGNYRFTGLQPNTDYAVRVFPVSNIGVRNTTAAYVHFTTGQDSTVPPAPTGAIIARGATTVIVKYTQLTAAEAADVANGNGTYEIQIDTATTFNTANLRSMISGDQIVAFNDVISEATWYARVRAIDSSGNVGPWSANAAPAVAGAVNDSMIVADLNAAKITVGFLSASRIATGSLVADKLATSSLTAATITISGSGQLFAGVWPTGALFNAAGIRLYKNGTPTVTMDSATGNATFVGTVSASTIAGSTISGGTVIGSHIRTATSGERVEIANPATNLGTIQFHTTAGVGYAGYIRMFWDSSKFTTTIETPEWPEGGYYSSRISMWSNSSGFGSNMILSSDNVVVNNGFASTVFSVFGTKNFRIPHPDHAGMDLVHSVIEGPECAVFYRGRATTGPDKKAVVSLPSYFEGLVRHDGRSVQLTPVGTPSILAATEPKDGKFQVVSEQADVDFWWEVKAVRSDVDLLVPEIESEQEEPRGTAKDGPPATNYGPPPDLFASGSPGRSKLRDRITAIAGRAEGS